MREIRKSIKRLQLLEKESSPVYENATKKELLSLEREMIRLQDQHRGIKDMKRLPSALFVVDAKFESIAINEAKRLVLFFLSSEVLKDTAPIFLSLSSQ